MNEQRKKQPLEAGRASLINSKILRISEICEKSKESKQEKTINTSEPKQKLREEIKANKEEKIHL